MRTSTVYVQRARWTVPAVLGAVLLSSCGAEGGSDDEDGEITDTVTIIVPNAPGGLADNSVRPLQQPLQQELGVDVVMENVTGAGGLIAANNVYDAEPDGTTLLAMVQPSAPLSDLYEEQAPDYQDFEFIGRLTGEDSMALAVSADSEYESVDDLVEAAEQETLRNATITGLNNQTLAEALFTENTGVDFTRVPYEGGSESVQAVIDGVAETTFASLSPLSAPVENGDLRILAYFSDEEIEGYEEYPLFADAYEDAGFTVGVGLVATPGTPEETVETLRTAVEAAGTSEAFEEQAGQNVNPSFLNGSEWREQFEGLYELAEEYEDSLVDFQAEAEG